MKFVAKKSEEEKYVEANPLFGTRKFHDDDRGTVEKPVLLRDPVTPAERKQVREVYKANIATVRKALVKKDCPKCKGRGFYDTPDYPGDPWYARLMSSIECACIWED
jgi:hypothetical protein